MASYISSNNNRFYVVTESAYGQIPAVTEANRIPAVQLAAQVQTEKVTRQDKTGTRTFQGIPSGLRHTTAFGLKTYLIGWTNQSQQPSYGPLFQAGLGGAAALWGGGSVASVPAATRLMFAAPHNLTAGQAISAGGEIRFAAAIVDPETIQLNAPFTATIGANSVVTATATYQPAAELPSTSIFDYWDPNTAAQRVLCGAAVNELTVTVNGDFHEFAFSGDACDLIDDLSFQSGQGGVSSYPAEPTVAPLNYSLVPGNLGEAWLGSGPSQFFTVTKAKLTFNNNLDLRSNEFGFGLPRGISPGVRNVSLEFTLYEQDDANTQSLYQAARQQSPISVMLQLGQQAGQLFGIYMPAVIPQVPEFDDSQKRLQWHFVNCRAQGGLNNEIYIAFG